VIVIILARLYCLLKPNVNISKQMSRVVTGSGKPIIRTFHIPQHSESFLQLPTKSQTNANIDTVDDELSD